MINAIAMTIRGIPCIVLRDTRNGHGPLLLHYHAWGEHKGNVSHPDITLVQAASLGFTVICPDCPEHGTRQTAAQFRKVMNGWAFLCTIMDQARQESRKLLDGVFALPFVSKDKPVVSGVSMGALIAQLVFAENRRLSALISVVGRSSFLQFDPWCRQAQRGSWADAWCAKHATQKRPKRFADRPVLFLDGGKDPLCPPAVNAKTVKLINRARGMVRQVVDRKAGHCFSERMRREFIDWIRIYRGLGR
jgi:dienelactone hydrolase